MGLLSKFKFGSKSPSGQAPASGASSEPSDVVREARVRARRRLIGASLLLGVGIVGFPLLFESGPRPIPVDIPIEIPAREGVAPLAPPAVRATPIRAQTAAAHGVEQGVAAAESEMVESAPPASAAKPSAEKASAAKPEAKPVAPKPAASKPDPKAEAKPAVKPAEPKPAEHKPDPKPAPAKPEAKPTAKPAEHVADEGRFVVQIGAFAEVASAREARMKVEGLGLKTYTQVIESSTGRRIRVRVGPYTNKAEAEKAASRIKSGGLQAAVLLL
jgi:DedD protein